MVHSKALLACGLATLLGLAGCSGVHYPAFYVLNVPAPPATPRQSKAVLGSAGVSEFASAGYLKGGYIVYRPNGEKVGFYPYDRWAEDPQHVVTKALVQDLQARGMFRSVHTYDGRESPDYLITGTLDHLEEIDDGRRVSSQVCVSARLIDTRTNLTLWSDTALKTGVLEERSVQGVVAEMSRQLGSVVSTLGASMQERVLVPSVSDHLTAEKK